MLLYAQDEIGSVTPELIAESRPRLERHAGGGGRGGRLLLDAPAQAARQASRPDLHQHQLPADGRRGALGARLRRSSASGTGRRPPDGQFSLEEVECMGACSWAPAMQVNYDFHHECDAGEARPADRFARLEAVAAPRETTGNAMLYNEPSPLEIKVLTRRFGLPADSAVARHVSSRQDGYEALAQGARHDAGGRSSTR